MTFNRLLAGIGRFLIAAGVLVLLFVGYTLWGTGIRTAQAQDRLERELEAAMSTTSTSPPEVSTTEGRQFESRPADPADLPPPNEGDPLGRIRVPSVGIDLVYAEGVSLPRLNEGPGHFPTTPFPGQPGNAAIAGHRVTYGQPFFRLDEVVAGDIIEVDTLQGSFRYEVLPQEPAYEGAPPRAHFIVQPGDTWILDPSDENVLTLMACHPKYSAAQRIVVRGKLIGPPAAAMPPSVPLDGSEHALPDELISDDGGDAGPAVAWSAATLALWAGVWFVARRWRAWRSPLWWATYGVGLVPFTVMLFFTFEAIARLLPAGF